MTNLIDLPRDLDAYFNYAELPALRDTRRFTLTFMYFDGERLDRLQWWWQVSAAQSRQGGDNLLTDLRAQAVQRFRAHIEAWLSNNQRRLFDGNPFPRLAIEVVPVEATDIPESHELPLPELLRATA